MMNVGLIINPVSGLGGSVGLKGTDGAAIVEQALARGAKPRSGLRALAALEALAPVESQFTLLVPPGKMGEDAARQAGLSPTVLGGVCQNARGALATSADDTAAAARAILQKGAGLLLFCGGDGTARDILEAVGRDVVVLGIPAGVKMHSAVFATTPQNAGLLAREFIENRVAQTDDAEVMDIDEAAFRNGQVSATLYGYMRIPLAPARTQGGKVSVRTDLAAKAGIGRDIVERMQPGCLYIIGPGSTTAAVTDALGLPGTLLGVDLVKDKQLLAADVGEREILAHLAEAGAAKIIVTPIGGQACLFGRGNQQFSPAVLQKVGRENIIAVATRAKLQSFYGSRLLVDTGDEGTNRRLSGHYRVLVAYRQETVFPAGA